jgi:hypothetical protein
MLAATVGVDGAVERQVRRVVAGDDGLGRLDAHFGALGGRHFLIPAVVLGHADGGRKTIMQVGGRAPTTGRQRSRHESASILFLYTVSRREVPDQCRLAVSAFV